MTWITDNKDLGAWPFTEQPDVWGYLNNPRWSNHPKAAADPMSASEFCEEKGISLDPTETHKPCGHWHKRRKITTSEIPPNLYGTGYNYTGQIGLEGGAIGEYEFVEVNDQAWSKVACGYYFSLAIKSDGTLWATGRNTEGQLGLGDNDVRYSWTQVGSGTDWEEIACGLYFSLAIKSDGSLWGCGQNDAYQLGINHDSSVNVFTQEVGEDTDWSKIAAGYDHSVAIKTDGTLYGAGSNWDDQLGLNDWDGCKQTYYQLSPTDCKEAICHEYGTVIIKTDGTMWSTGYNWAGQLGLGDDSDRLVFTQVPGSDWDKISSGSSHTLAIKTNKTLWGCGYTYDGELGLEPTEGDTPGCYYSFAQIGSNSDWLLVAGSVDTSAAINESYELWVTGDNQYGELGLGDHAQRWEFVQVEGSYKAIDLGWNHSVAIDSIDLLKVTGNQRYGPLGLGDRLYITSLTLVNDETWLAVDCWNVHTLAIKDDKTLWGCGHNSWGELGLGDNTYLRYILTLINGESIWKQVASAGAHSLALTEDGKIYSCGYSGSGRLGRTVNDDSNQLVQVTGEDWIFIAAGASVSFGIKEDTTLWAWGDNSGANQGQLGLSDSIDRSVPTECIGTGWKQVSAGSCHAAAVRSDGTLWTTGRNQYGQLGLNDSTSRLIWTQVGSDTDWDYTECGWDFTLAVKTDGSLYGTGYNTTGCLGLDDTTHRKVFTKISDGWSHDSYEGLPQFSGGCFHSLAIYGNSVLYATGDNYYGQLGLDCSGYEAVDGGGGAADEDRDEFEATADSIPLDDITDTWDFVVSGQYHTMALKIVSATETTGYNDDDEPQVWSLPTKGPSL